MRRSAENDVKLLKAIIPHRFHYRNVVERLLNKLPRFEKLQLDASG